MNFLCQPIETKDETALALSTWKMSIFDHFDSRILTWKIILHLVLILSIFVLFTTTGDSFSIISYQSSEILLSNERVFFVIIQKYHLLQHEVTTIIFLVDLMNWKQFFFLISYSSHILVNLFLNENLNIIWNVENSQKLIVFFCLSVCDKIFILVKFIKSFFLRKIEKKENWFSFISVHGNWSRSPPEQPILPGALATKKTRGFETLRPCFE